jgi:hypothetical protein
MGILLRSKYFLINKCRNNDEEYLVYTVYFNQNGVAQKVEVNGAS